jgi:predicted ATPase/class 3 adenylate cyclase
MNENVARVSTPSDLAISFVPAVLRRHYADYPSANKAASAGGQTATLLWVDICNFSPLCNRLMKDVVNGVEKITGILNSHYDFVLNTIHACGGEPLFFVGDGIMAAWPGDQIAAEEAVPLAAACAQKILQEEATKDDQDKRLSIHAVISVGPWNLLEFEGTKDKLLYSFFGDVFNTIVAASKNVAPDQLLISNAALRFLDKKLRWRPVEHDTAILLDSPAMPVLPRKKSLALTPAATRKLRSFVPQTLIFPINAERLKWIAEIRPVTVLFIRLANDYQNTSANLEQLRGSIKLARPLVLKHDGLLNQIWLDEKQSNILICFGPPPSAHMDNPERCVRLALELHQLLNEAGFQNSMGLSTGMAYCGILGNDILRQYTVIGDVVNLSARIAGIGQNKIYCDKATRNASHKTIRYKPHFTRVLKGFSDPVVLNEPEAVVENNAPNPAILSVIGRERELNVLLEAYQRATAGEGSCIMIEGENGMGKTRLLEAFRLQVVKNKGFVLSSSGDYINRNTPYQIWETIFSTLLGLDGVVSSEGTQETLQRIVARYGFKASLLNAVLPIDFSESEETRALTESQKVVATHKFLLQVLEEESAGRPLVIVIDDAHWVADELSWQLLGSVASRLRNSLLVLSFQKTVDFSGMAATIEEVRHLVLQELSDEGMEALIRAKLKVAAVAGDVFGLVKRIAKGNPFFCIELVGSLLDQQLLTFKDDCCFLAADASLSDFALPETVRGAVRRRIDHLDRGAQLSLKVASVVGNRFGKKVIDDIYPINIERESVPVYLAGAAKAGFIRAQTVDNMEGYQFSSVTTSEVAYEMTLAEQRRYLHRETALWYEQQFRDNLPPFYVRLAHHWQHAGEKSKAATYQEKEAIRLFRLGFVKQALDVGLEGVRLLGQDIDRDPTLIGQKIMEHFGFITGFMEGRSIESLVFHKKLLNENTGMVIKLLLELCPFAHQCQEAELFALMAIISLRRTLEEGNGEAAAEVYSMYSIIHKSLTGDSVTALAWSRLALAIDEQNGHILQARVSFIHCWFIAHWLVPHRELVPLAAGGADAGLASGDVLFGCFCLSLEVVLRATAGQPLDEVIRTAEAHQSRNNQAVLNAAFHLVHEAQVAKALQGRTKSVTSLSDESRDEEKDIASICHTDLYNQIGYYLISKLKLNAHFGRWQEAASWGEKAMPLLPAFAHQPGQIDFEQFFTIAALYAAAGTSGEEAAKLRNRAAAGTETMNTWAALCPGNFSHKALLLQGISDGLNGNIAQAENCFAQAAAKALETGYLHDRGLAFEHLARLQKNAGLDALPAARAAIEAYTDWGAFGKVNYLRELFAI